MVQIKRDNVTNKKELCKNGNAVNIKKLCYK